MHTFRFSSSACQDLTPDPYSIVSRRPLRAGCAVAAIGSRRPLRAGRPGGRRVYLVGERIELVAHDLRIQVRMVGGLGGVVGHGFYWVRMALLGFRSRTRQRQTCLRIVYLSLGHYPPYSCFPRIRCQTTSATTATIPPIA